MNTDASPATPPPPHPAAPVPPVAPAPRPGGPSSGDKALIVLSHLSALIGAGFLLPFIVWLVKKDDADSTVAAHAKEALNFHISLLIYTLCCVPLAFVIIGIPLLFALGAAGLVFAIIAAIKASDGGFYRYPLTIRLIG